MTARDTTNALTKGELPPLSIQPVNESISAYVNTNYVNINLERVHQWIIVANGYDTHYIEKSCSWKQAILEHIEWAYGKSKNYLYEAAFNGFDDMQHAIEFYNTIFADDEIVYMSPVIESETYINPKKL